MEFQSILLWIIAGQGIVILLQGFLLYVRTERQIQRVEKNENDIDRAFLNGFGTAKEIILACIREFKSNDRPD